MTALSEAILKSATEALIIRSEVSSAKGALSDPREDARAVMVAVLVGLGGAKGRRGLLPLHNGISQTLLAMADGLEAEGT